MKSTSKLKATLCSHSLILSVVKCMQCQVLNFLIVLYTKDNNIHFHNHRCAVRLNDCLAV